MLPITSDAAVAIITIATVSNSVTFARALPSRQNACPSKLGRFCEHLMPKGWRA